MLAFHQCKASRREALKTGNTPGTRAWVSVAYKLCGSKHLLCASLGNHVCGKCYSCNHGGARRNERKKEGSEELKE